MWLLWKHIIGDKFISCLLLFNTPRDALPQKLRSFVDSFTVPLHSPDSRQKETVSGVWKTVEIPTGHVIP